MSIKAWKNTRNFIFFLYFFHLFNPTKPPAIKCVLGHAVCFSLPLTFYGTRLLEPSPPLSFLMRALTFDLLHSPSRPRSYFHALAHPHALALACIHSHALSLLQQSQRQSRRPRSSRPRRRTLKSGACAQVFCKRVRCKELLASLQESCCNYLIDYWIEHCYQR